MMALHNFYHAAQDGVSFQQTLETGRAITGAMQIATELGDRDHRFTDGEFFLT
jgi:hypothetical protein